MHESPIELFDVADYTKKVNDERKKGRWISSYPNIEPNPMFGFSICSICGFRQSLWNKLNYCPNCGAEMEGEE